MFSKDREDFWIRQSYIFTFLARLQFAFLNAHELSLWLKSPGPNLAKPKINLVCKICSHTNTTLTNNDLLMTSFCFFLDNSMNEEYGEEEVSKGK